MDAFPILLDIDTDDDFAKLDIFFLFIFYLLLQLCLKGTIDTELKNLVWCKVTKGWFAWFIVSNM